MLLSLWDLEQLLLTLLETRLIPVTSFESELFTCVAEISGGSGRDQRSREARAKFFRRVGRCAVFCHPSPPLKLWPAMAANSSS